MPWSLRRYHQTGGLHFLTWSCHDREPLLATPGSRDLLLKVVEQMRNRYRFGVVGYVVMPEHVHVLISEPLIGNLSAAVCAIKLGVTRRMLKDPHFWQTRPEVGHPKTGLGQHFWMKRYYDFNLWSQRKEFEKLRYMYRNPVARGLVERPQDWPWSSFNTYATGQEGIVRINDWSWWEKRICSQSSSN